MSIVLDIAAPLISKIMIIVSLLLVLQGHNNPGGGFIGALVGCSATALYLFTSKTISDRLEWNFINIGLLCFLFSLFLPLAKGQNMLTGIWCSFHLYGQTFKLGTPLLFDFGIYFIVLGCTTLICKSFHGKVS